MTKIKRLFLVTLLLLFTAGTLWLLAGLYAWIPPKDLGVRYTKNDIDSAMTKVGITVNFEGKTGAVLEQFKRDLGNKRLNINDYNWKFTNYEKRTFKLTPSEATALLNNINNIAPGLWWFDDIQVTVFADGRMAGSCRTYADKLKNELYPDAANMISFPIPGMTNLYGDGITNISDNSLNTISKNVELGPLPLPDQYKSAEMSTKISPYLERIYKVVPGLEIYSLTADSERNFVFDGLVPQNIEITRK